ncbi:MAG: hypothetical protein V7L25_02800 [Nostoc sp.]|uniref:hypothetical protein n=1 Tax=Nostoc sp. TaxID=1180 RepID=UPI002FF124F8
MADLNNSGTGNSPTGGDNLLRDSPFGRLLEVVSKEDLFKQFSGLGNGKGSGSPFGGSASGSKPDLAYGGDPFAGDNFWNIFAGGKNPSAGSGNQGSTTDPLTGVGSQGSSISTTEIPDGFGLKVTIDNLVNSRLKEAQSGSGIPSSGSGGIPPFGGGGGIPSSGGSGGIPSSGGSSGIPPFGGSSGIPSSGGSGGIPPFGGSGGIPSSGNSEIPPFGGGSISPFGGGSIPFA